ncbi:MAG: 16S rRNA (cytosine(1402)-N(4))-methyltransferase RsmH [Clostridia bacterium]|nr:16S rRNA (cytosine(1402)-N(4))-methyltransferase RsmH [Clostridia bacterium]
MPEFNHISVLKEELTDGIITDKDGIYCDMTLGGAGHSKRLLELTDKAVLLGIDRDPLALSVAKERLSEFSGRVKLYHGNFSEIDIAAEENGISAFDGIMADLGVSSPQLDDAERGFSYMHDAPLDMRMDTTSKFSAYDVVNGYSESELMRIIGSYGEERWAKRIAEFIVKNRPVKTTLELVEVIKAAVPAGAREKGGHPAKRTFQAIRIEVNGELEAVENALGKAVSLLKSGGRIGVITFHSLEDRLVKQAFQTLAKGCTCPSSFPVCVCGKKPEIKIVTKKPVLPGEKEIIENSRAKSAKLRIAEKL